MIAQLPGGTWSAPSFLACRHLSLGLTCGFQHTKRAIAIATQEALDAFMVGGGGRCWWAGRELERRGWTLPLKRRTNLILHHELCGCDVSCAATPPTSPPHPTHPHPHPPTRCRAQGEHADGGWDVHFSSQDPLHVEPSAWVVAAGPPPAGPAALHPDRHRSTAYLVAQGAMFDVSRRCGLSFVDEGLNSALYGARAAPADILAGRFQRPPEFELLYAALAQVQLLLHA